MTRPSRTARLIVHSVDPQRSAARLIVTSRGCKAGDTLPGPPDTTHNYPARACDLQGERPQNRSMRGLPTQKPSGEVKIQPPAEPAALREAAEGESGPARGFTGPPAQGAAQPALVEQLAGPDSQDVEALEQLIPLALELIAYGMGGIKSKLLREMGRGLFEMAGMASKSVSEPAAIAIVRSGAPEGALTGMRLAGWVARPIRYGLAKAAPERFAEPPSAPPKPNPMQQGGAEPPPRPAPTATLSAAPAALPPLAISDG